MLHDVSHLPVKQVVLGPQIGMIQAQRNLYFAVDNRNTEREVRGELERIGLLAIGKTSIPDNRGGFMVPIDGDILRENFAQIEEEISYKIIEKNLLIRARLLAIMSGMREFSSQKAEKIVPGDPNNLQKTLARTEKRIAGNKLSQGCAATIVGTATGVGVVLLKTIGAIDYNQPLHNKALIGLVGIALCVLSISSAKIGEKKAILKQEESFLKDIIKRLNRAESPGPRERS